MIILGCGCGGAVEFVILLKILSFFGITITGWTFRGFLKNLFSSNKDKQKQHDNNCSSKESN